MKREVSCSCTLVGAAIYALVSLFVASPTWAQEEGRWRVLGSGGVPREVDIRSVVPIEAGQYRIWIRASYPDGTKILQQEDYDCMQRCWRLIRTVGYDPSGMPMNDLDHSSTASWKPVIPGSIGENELERVCGMIRHSRDSTE